MSQANLCIDNYDRCHSNQKNQQRNWQQQFKHWYQNWRTRRQLLQLDSYQLKDIGISHGQARQEAAKPFWQD